MKMPGFKLNLNFLLITTFLLIGVLISCNQKEKAGSVEKNVKFGEWTPRIGGCGGIFFEVSKSPLVIEIEKQDLNLNRSKTSLRAVFVGPDRQVIQDSWIPDDGLEAKSGTGPAQALRLSTHVDRPGVYAVMIEVSNDRYGEAINWRFRTNCDKFMIETSRGHKDSRHEEPIVLLDPDREADLLFLPQKSPFEIQITDLPADMATIDLLDAKKRKLAVLEVKDGVVSHKMEEGNRISTPWCLHFTKAKAKVQIDGVTRWMAEDESEFFSRYPDASLWSTEADSWFPIHQNRWLITPYSRTVYAQEGESSSVKFRVHNNGVVPAEVKLKLEFPDEKWDVKLSENLVKIGPQEEKEVTLNWTGMPGDEKVLLRATSGKYTTYSALIAKAGKTPADSPLETPMVFTPYKQENEQFGYLPEYPVENQIYFNAQNRPFVRTVEGITSLRDGKWETTKLPQSGSSIIAFDKEGAVYGIAMQQGKPVLMYSKDDGQTFIAIDIPGDNVNSSIDIEQFSGHNIPDGPPPVIRFTRTVTDLNYSFRRYGDLELLIPKKTENGIEWEDPVLISSNCLGLSPTSSIISHGSKIFLVWGEATDPVLDKKIPGVPAYVTTYDKQTRKLGKPVLIGYGAPPNDTHNKPSIIIDSKGYLHVLTGTHGRPFNYSRSLKPYETHGGWTKAEPVMQSEGSQSTQTYIAFVAGPDNKLHLVFRLWRYYTDYFPESYFASLSYMSKKEGEPWSSPRMLVVAPFSHYSVYNHRMTIDRMGQLYLSYAYWSTYWFYRTDLLGSHRALLMSPDGGQTWKLTGNDDFKLLKQPKLSE